MNYVIESLNYEKVVVTTDKGFYRVDFDEIAHIDKPTTRNFIDTTHVIHIALTDGRHIHIESRYGDEIMQLHDAIVALYLTWLRNVGVYESSVTPPTITTINKTTLVIYWGNSKVYIDKASLKGVRIEHKAVRIIFEGREDILLKSDKDDYLKRVDEGISYELREKK